MELRRNRTASHDVGVGSRVESGGVRHTDVEMVPGVTLDEKARDVTHPGDVDTVRSPILVFSPAEIPCDAAHGNEMIPAVGSVPVRLLPDPLGHHPAMTVAISGRVVGPEILTDGESGVERDVERRRGLRIISPATVVEDPVVEDDLGDELISPEP